MGRIKGRKIRRRGGAEQKGEAAAGLETSGFARPRPPVGVSPGLWWAEQQVDSGLTRLGWLRQEIAELGRTASHVVISLEDPGEPRRLGGAGDMPEWERRPFEKIVWIGPIEDTERAMRAMLTHPSVGKVLCEGATMRVGECNLADPDAQREEARAIAARVAARPPHPAMPFVDHAVYHATRLANSVVAEPAAAAAVPDPDSGADAIGIARTGRENSSTLSADVEDFGRWRRAGAALTYDGQPVTGLSELPLKIVRLLVREDGWADKAKLIKAVWGDHPPSSESGLASMFTITRNQLRRAFGLNKGDDPLPTQGRKEAAQIRLDDELLKRSRVSKE